MNAAELLRHNAEVSWVLRHMYAPALGAALEQLTPCGELDVAERLLSAWRCGLVVTDTVEWLLTLDAAFAVAVWQVRPDAMDLLNDLRFYDWPQLAGMLLRRGLYAEADRVALTLIADDAGVSPLECVEAAALLEVAA